MDLKKYIHKNALNCPWCGQQFSVREKSRISPQYKHRCKNCKKEISTPYIAWPLTAVFGLIIGLIYFLVYKKTWFYILMIAIAVVIKHYIHTYIEPIIKKGDDRYKEENE